MPNYLTLAYQRIADATGLPVEQIRAAATPKKTPKPAYWKMLRDACKAQPGLLVAVCAAVQSGEIKVAK